MAGAHAGGLLDQLALELRVQQRNCGCSSGAADDGPGDSSANGGSRVDSGTREAARSDTDGAAIGACACVDRIVGGRCSGGGLRAMKARRTRGRRGASEPTRRCLISGEIPAVRLLPVLLGGWRGPAGRGVPAWT